MLYVFTFIIDMAYQLFVLRFFYPLQSLIVALGIAILPYMILRGPVTRLSRRYKSKTEQKGELQSNKVE